jgi:tRNA A-37 threonylcarbamoyl transferase component Bud32
VVGQTILHYKILELIGQGSMGIAYKAQDVNLDRLVVLKFLRRELLEDQTARTRFLREAKAASALDHRNICTFYGLEQAEDGRPFISMAFYEGETLKEKLKRGHLPLDLTASITTQIAEGLSEVHRKGIVHRNIKPENIIVTMDGTVKILDFGLAKLGASTGLTQVGRTMGSPVYMSPEQLRGENVDHRTDIWALGVLAYAMLAGRKPFEAQSGETLVYLITQSDPPPISQVRTDVPTKWDQILRKALAKNVYERYQQMTGLLEDIKAMTAPPVAGAGAGWAGVTIEQPKLGMAFVLFLDIVGYSKLMMDAQAEIIDELTKIVQATDQFRRAKETDQLILLPTGDGMALVFFNDLMAPVECAVKIAQALRNHARLKLRMGVHSGPVYRTVDINKARNVAGSGINLAQRVMDCGDEGHILISKSYADFLDQLTEWKDQTHDLGVVEVKHGVPVHIFNLYGTGFGNPALPKKVEAREAQPPSAGPEAPSVSRPEAASPISRSNRTLPLAVALVVAAVVGVAAWTGALDWKSVYCRLVPSAQGCGAPAGEVPLPAKPSTPTKSGVRLGESATRAPVAGGLQRAERALEAGDLDTARRELESAKMLAPADPRVREVEQLIQDRARSTLLRKYLPVGGVLILGLAVILSLARRGPQGELCIEVVSGPEEGRKVALVKDVTRLGAASREDGRENDVVLADKERMISRFHCEIHRRKNNFFLVDPGSVNGTFLNGELLKPRKFVRLKPGAEVDLAHRVTIRLALVRPKK